MRFYLHELEKLRACIDTKADESEVVAAVIRLIEREKVSVIMDLPVIFTDRVIIPYIHK